MVIDEGAKQVEAGAERFRELGWVACHTRTDETKKDAALGGRIHLGFVKQKWYAAALVAYLQDPSEHYSDVRMPNLQVSLDDAVNLAGYLLKGGAPLPVKAGDEKKGRRLVRKHGCVLCHTFGDDIPPVDRIFPRYRNLKPKRGCLADKARGNAPDHSLSEEQREALRAFLPFAGEAPFRKSPLDYGARHMDSERCSACHAIDGQASTWAQLAEKWSMDEPLPPEQDPVAQGVPVPPPAAYYAEAARTNGSFASRSVRDAAPQGDGAPGAAPTPAKWSGEDTCGVICSEELSESERPAARLSCAFLNNCSHKNMSLLPTLSV